MNTTKKYELPEDSTMVASEPIAAVALETVLPEISAMESYADTVVYDGKKEPYQLSMDELRQILLETETDVITGNLFSSDEVHKQALDIVYGN